MNIIEAIKSGRRFKRPNDREWWGVCEANGYIAPVGCVDECHSVLPPTAEDVLAEDWILEEPIVTITASQFWTAAESSFGFKAPSSFRVAVYQFTGTEPPAYYSLLVDLALRLGLVDPSAGPEGREWR